MDEKDLIIRLREITGNTGEGLVFLKSFQSIEQESFAVIYAESEVFQESPEILFHDLKFLRVLGLLPVVCIHENTITKNIISEDKFNDSFSIVESSGNIKDKLVSIIRSKKIPVLYLKAGSDPFHPLSGLCESLKSRKMIYLTNFPGFTEPETGNIYSIIRIPGTDTNLKSADQVLFGRLLSLFQGKENQNFSISITSPSSLLKELFTIKGSGTYLRRGSRILSYNGWGGIDKEKIRILLESSFNKKLKDNFFERDADIILLEENFRGAAILRKEPNGFLLSKFAVNEVARGEGIGREIWDEMERKASPIFWRAKPGNFINKWYARECSGMNKFSDWYVYWKGLPVDTIPDVCAFLRSLPEDFD